MQNLSDAAILLLTRQWGLEDIDWGFLPVQGICHINNLA